MSEPEALTDDPVQVEVLRTETPFTGRVWNIRRDAFAYNGDTIVREYVDHTGAVAVLAMDDQERVLLIKQYRHPVRARDWEIPAGLLDVAGEDALAAAQRDHPLTQVQRLVELVRHEDHRDFLLPPNRQQFVGQRGAGGVVERTERFVQQ